MQGRAAAALAAIQAAIAADPAYAEAHNSLGVLLRDTGDVPEAIAAYDACLALDPHHRSAGQNRLLALTSVARARARPRMDARLLALFAADVLCSFFV